MAQIPFPKENAQHLTDLGLYDTDVYSQIPRGGIPCTTEESGDFVQVTFEDQYLDEFATKFKGVAKEAYLYDANGDTVMDRFQFPETRDSYVIGAGKAFSDTEQHVHFWDIDYRASEPKDDGLIGGTDFLPIAAQTIEDWIENPVSPLPSNVPRAPRAIGSPSSIDPEAPAEDPAADSSHAAVDAFGAPYVDTEYGRIRLIHEDDPRLSLYRYTVVLKNSTTLLTDVYKVPGRTYRLVGKTHNYGDVMVNADQETGVFEIPEGWEHPSEAEFLQFIG